MAQGEHGGGHNNVNKKAHGRAAEAPAAPRQGIAPVIYHGTNPTTGPIPVPVETTERPSRGG